MLYTQEEAPDTKLGAWILADHHTTVQVLHGLAQNLDYVCSFTYDYIPSDVYKIFQIIDISLSIKAIFKVCTLILHLQWNTSLRFIYRHLISCRHK